MTNLALSHKELAAKLRELEGKVTGHDDVIAQVVAAIRQLMMPSADPKPKRRIGFRREQEKEPPP